MTDEYRPFILESFRTNVLSHLTLPRTISNPIVMSPPQLIRITVCARRNSKLSEAEFNAHWANKHAPLITSWLQRHNCVKYVQVACPTLLTLA
jgi:hypothetical protein